MALTNRLTPGLTDANPTNGSTSLASLNPFLIKKVIDGYAGAVERVKKVADGDLLIETINSSQVKDLLKLHKFH